MFNIELFLVFMKTKYRTNGFKSFKNEIFSLVFCEHFVTFKISILEKKLRFYSHFKQKKEEIEAKKHPYTS